MSRHREAVSTAQLEVLRALDESVIITDADGVVWFWNDAAARLFGYSEPDALGRNVSTLTIPPEQQAEAAAVMASLNAGMTWSGEFTLARADGSTFTAYVVDAPLLDGDGSFVGILGLVVDQRAKLRTRTAAQLAESLVSCMEDTVVAFDADAVITSVNPAAARLYGRESADMVGRPLSSLVTPERRIRAAEVVQALTDGRSVPPYQGLHVDAAGTRVPVWISLGALRDGMGDVVGGVAVVRDLRTTVTADRVLSELIARFDTRFASSPLPQALVRVDGVVTSVNVALGELLQRPPEQLEGQPFSALLEVADVDPQLAGFHALLRAERRTGMARLRLLRGDGRPVTCLVTASVVSHDDGRPGYVSVYVQDVTEADELRAAEQRATQHLQAMVNALPAITFTFDAEGRITTVSGEGRDHFGADAPDVGDVVFEGDFDSAPLVRDCVRRALDGEDVVDVVLRAPSRTWKASYRPLRDEEGTVVGGVGVAHDVTDLVIAQQAQQVAERNYRALMDNAQEGVWTVNPEGRVEECNVAAARLLGYAVDHIVGRPVLEFVVEEQHDDVRASLERVRTGEAQRAERCFRTADGRHVWAAVTSTPVFDESGRHVTTLSTLTDISEHKRFESELARQALHDALTGLPNRVLMFDRLEHALTRSTRRAGESVALLFCDVDHFKDVNDGLGHAAGDALLVQIADRLAGAVRTGDTVARFGGDEFVVLCEDIDLVAAQRVGERVHEAMREPFLLGDAEVLASVSVGCALSQPGQGANGLLSSADAAMYVAKSSGRARTALFDEDQRERAARRIQIGSDLHRAIETRELVVHYQPVLDAASTRVVGVESLVRWQQGERVVPPDAFLPIAEETGLIIDLGRLVLEEAVQAMAELEGETGRALPVSVNLSARQLSHDSVVDDVQSALRASGLPASRLCLEVTETAVMDDAESAIAILHRLKALGVRLSIDDFGTGYSSLVYLKRLPVDELKIDRQFVAGLLTDTEDEAIVTSILSLASAVHVQAVAEGVENIDQHERLRLLGCQRTQGYLYGAAVPLDELAGLISIIESGGWHVMHSARKRRPVIDAVARQRIGDLAATGASPSTIAAALNRQGLRTPQGVRWHSASVARVLADNGWQPAIPLPG